ncbi:MAG TPA: LysM peptidoglycan-binding domain-containing protein [Steroidobacteraceae bacterium]|nr:LysM peptidoglycan-binding domain-containing protein [Steroidobacteraceae bacterium]
MITDHLRWTQSGVVLSALLALAACAHAPGTRPATAPQVITATGTSGAASASATTPGTAAASTDSTSSSVAQSGADSTDSSAEQGELPQVAGINPDDYADLFDRMRAGFKLGDVDRPAVQQQLQWFVDNPDYVQRSFRRSELYLYHIVKQLESRGMPLELALLPVIESAYEPYAYSRARAMGLWQFIPGTGSRFGLKQNWWYDGRRDVIESTRAALDYLQYLHDEFHGDWLLAIAGYNCGEAAIVQAIAVNQAHGRPIDFWSLRLPAETRAYVPKLLAMKRLVAAPENYSLTFSPIPNRPYFVSVETFGQIDLRVAAEIAGVSPEVLYELNPAFHRWATDPSGPYSLLLPTDAADVFRANITQLNPDERMRVTQYVVRRGDSMAALARHFGTTPQVVRELNDLPSGALVIGTELRVPSDVSELPPKVLQAAALFDAHGRHRLLRPRMRVVVHRGDSLWAIARRHGVDVHALALLNGLQPGDTLRAGQRLMLTPAAVRTSDASGTSSHSHATRRVTYIVRAGDTLYGIARVFQVTVSQIVSWNRLAHRALSPGQHLLIRLARGGGSLAAE